MTAFGAEAVAEPEAEPMISARQHLDAEAFIMVVATAKREGDE